MKLILINTEKRLALACVAIGCCLSALLAPKDSYFLPNFLFYWGTQVLVLVFALIFRPRAAVIVGIAFSLSAYFGLFCAWVYRTHAGSMAWLGYVFSLPGAVISVVLVSFFLQRQRSLGPLHAGLLAAFSVAIGIAINQAVICNTVMYCSLT